MKWINIKDEFPRYGDNVTILISNGKEVWTAYEDHGELWFASETNDNEALLLSQITHWAFLKDVPLPKDTQ